MTLNIVPIELPTGMWKNGTPYSGRNRWVNGSRVRWHDGSLRPIGGWERRTVKATDVIMPPIISDPLTETIRDMAAWTENNGNQSAVLGSNTALYYMTSNNDINDITPVGFVGGVNDVTFLRGYGTGPYGRGPYGTARTQTGAQIEQVFRWNFDNWGEDLLAAGVDNGPLYSYNSVDSNAVAVPNAPEGSNDFCVTDERIVMMIDPDGYDIRTVVWSHRENREEWTPTTQNYAGFYTLSGVGALLSITKIQDQYLILSETDAYVGSFVGRPYVYGFDKVGDDCGPIHSKVIATTDRFAMWLSSRQFWMYDGTLKPIKCEVMDFLQRDISKDHASKIHCHTVDDFSEIWWHYQSEDSDEVDSYVAYDWLAGEWQVGKLNNRTAAHDRAPLTSVIMVDAAGTVWNHEIPNVLVPDAYAETGPLELRNGAQNLAVRYILPDTEQFGSVAISLMGSQMPTAQERTYGPYQYRNPTPTTGAMGRQIRMRVDGLRNRWEVGTMRFDVAPLTGGR